MLYSFSQNSYWHTRSTNFGKLFCLKNQFIIDKAPRSFFAEGLDRPKNYNESKKLSLSTFLLFYICTESRTSLYLDGWSKNLLLFIRKEAIWWSFSLPVFEYHLITVIPVWTFKCGDTKLVRPSPQNVQSRIGDYTDYGHPMKA